MSHLLTPTILLLKDGSETAQGKSHVIHNINACQAIGEIVKTTLGPRGMDKLIYTQNGRVTISNDGRTIIELLDIVHPAAKTLVDIAIAQDKQVGDGTTTVVILASEFLKQAKIFIEDGVHPQTIIKAYRRACNAVLERLNTLAVDYRKKQEEEKNTLNGVEEDNDNKNDNNDSKNNDILNTIHYRNILEKCAKTALQSKLIATHRDYFSKIAVDAVLLLNPNQLDLELIGICKVPGGSVTESEFVKGVAFKKTFSYAGFEQQPKKFTNPKILVLNIELELKAEKENAEVRLKDPDEYQSIVDAEWEIIYDKLEKIYKSGANVILSRLAIGDLATQYFADRNIFCAGRVPENDLKRISIATGAIIQTTLNDLSDNVIGSADNFEEKQIGSERYNYITNCKNRYISTIILRGGAEQFIEETHRSLWDALMVIKRCIQHCEIVGGGGAIEMELSKFLREYSKQIKDKTQLVIGAYAKALEIIPRQLSHNAGLDSTDIINQLRYQHAKGHRWYGIDIENGGVFDTLEHFIWEPSINKKSAINAATEATCTILSIDETIKNAKATDANQAANRPAPPPGHGLSSKPSIR